MMQLTKEQRDEIRALADAATEGPWEMFYRAGAGQEVWRGQIAPICHMRWTDGLRPEVEKRVEADGEFIAAARTAVPQLLDALDAADAEIERLKELVRSLGKQLRAWEPDEQEGQWDE